MHLERIANSMAPPHFSLSWIHVQYAPLGFPRKPSVYCSGLPATVSAITLLQPSRQLSRAFCSYIACGRALTKVLFAWLDPHNPKPVQSHDNSMHPTGTLEGRLNMPTTFNLHVRHRIVRPKIEVVSGTGACLSSGAWSLFLSMT